MPPPARLAIAGPPQVTSSREVVPYRPRQLSRRAEGNLSMDRKKEQLFNQRLSFQPYYKYKPRANTYFKYLSDDDELMSNEDDDEDTDADSEYKCVKCGVNFTTLSALNKHQPHCNPRYFFCQYCGKNYSSMNGLKAHVKNTHQTRPVQKYTT